MKLPRREFLRVAAAAAALPAAAVRASAQSYPTRPVRLILGFPAGGSTDLVARIMAAWLTERLGQSVVVENKPGGGTNLAAQAAINSPPDGYTLLFVTTTNAINATFYPTLPFNVLRDIAPVAGLVDLPFEHALGRRRPLHHGKPGLPFGRRADRPGHKASAAVRTDVEKHVIDAIRTERALV